METLISDLIFRSFGRRYVPCCLGFLQSRFLEIQVGYHFLHRVSSSREVNDEEPLPYPVLTGIADALLEKGEDDPEVLAVSLERLDPRIREDLFASDLLNAFQIFYFYFRENPGDLEAERLMLQPGSALVTGVVVAERVSCEVIFLVAGGSPVISVGDGQTVLASFTGQDAYLKALSFIDEHL